MELKQCRGYEKGPTVGSLPEDAQERAAGYFLPLLHGECANIVVQTDLGTVFTKGQQPS